MRTDLAILDDRTVIAIAGPEARDFLQRLITNDVESLAPCEVRYAALLSPQGKIVTDFLVVGDTDGVLLDTPVATALDLVKKLSLYRLRAKVTIADQSAALAVMAFLGEAPGDATQVFSDPRDPALWRRAFVPRAALDGLSPGTGALDAYRTDRIAAGVPEGGLDFAYGDTFPHDANLDHLHGVDFTKGCYVGQEVVSRVQHRGTARKRIVAATFTGDAPPPGTDIVTGGVTIGTMGSAMGTRGLATVRLDRLAEATGPVTAGDMTLRLSIPAWAS